MPVPLAFLLFKLYEDYVWGSLRNVMKAKQSRGTYEVTGPQARACLHDKAVKAKLPSPAQVLAAADVTPRHLLLLPFTHQPQLLASAHRIRMSRMQQSVSHWQRPALRVNLGVPYW